MKKAIKVYETILTVEGAGAFPLDMLRYDSCVPFSDADAHALGEVDPRERRVVTLRRLSKSGLPATAGRWGSFGWRVVSEDAV